MVRILGLCGSPRKGATEAVVREALHAAEQIPGVETEFMTLRGKKIAPCNGCGYCRKHHCGCVLKDDMQELIDRFIQADAYIIASPVYVHGITPHLAAFFSRLRPVADRMPETLRSKFGAAVAVGGARNGGQEMAVTIMIQLMMTRGMNVVSGEYRGYIGGKVWSDTAETDFAPEDDACGMKTVTELAKKLAECAVIFDAGKRAVTNEKRQLDTNL